MIQVVFLYFILAGTFTFGKMLLSFVPPIFLIGIRMTFAGLCIVTANFIAGNKIAIKRSDVPFFFLMSFIHIFIPYVTEFVGLNQMSPSCAALIYNLAPCFTALFAYFIFNEVMNTKKWIGFSISFLGVLYMMPLKEILCFNSMNFGYILMLISVISCSLAWNLVKLLVNRGYSILQINGITMILGGIEALLFAHIFETSPAAGWYTHTNFWLLFIGIIILSNFIYYNFYGYLLHRYSATLLSFIGFITPLFTSLYDYIFLGMSVGTEFYIATIIVTYGIYIFYQEELHQGYISK